MLILGIDPGTIVMGYGLVEAAGADLRFVECGTVSASRTRAAPERLAEIQRGLSEIIERARPDLAAVEKAFFGKSAASAIRIGEARGIALQACAAAGVEVVEITPSEVKRAVVGRGSATKEQVARMVGVLLDLSGPVESADAADALAVAIGAAHRRRAEELGGGSGKKRRRGR